MGIKSFDRFFNPSKQSCLDWIKHDVPCYLGYASVDEMRATIADRHIAKEQFRRKIKDPYRCYVAPIKGGVVIREWYDVDGKASISLRTDYITM